MPEIVEADQRQLRPPHETLKRRRDSLGMNKAAVLSREDSSGVFPCCTPAKPLFRLFTTMTAKRSDEVVISNEAGRLRVALECP